MNKIKKETGIGTTFRWKEWLTLQQAAKYLSNVLHDEVTEADLLSFARQKYLKLSVYFPNLTKAKYGEIVRYPRHELEASLAADHVPSQLEWILLSPETASSLPDLPHEAEGEPVLVIERLKIDADHYVRFPGQVKTIGGVYDLPMIGGEQLDIENGRQKLINGQPIVWTAREGVIVQGADGRFYQLQEQDNVKEYSAIWNADQRKLKQHLADGDFGEKDRERYINDHKAERRQKLQEIKALAIDESYRPAKHLPKDSNLVVRQNALLEFETLVMNAELDQNLPTIDKEQRSSRASSCKAVNAGKIMQHFNVKTDPDENIQWWKKMMRNASDNGLAECRVGAGIKGPGGSTWCPDAIAGWLVDRHEKGLDGLNEKAAGAALKKFPGCEEIADQFFSSDE